MQFRLEKEFVVLEIEDNGVGMAASAQHKKEGENKHQSLASVITQERIEAFQKSINKKIIIYMSHPTEHVTSMVPEIQAEGHGEAH